MSLFDSLFRLITIRQQDTESLQEYIVRFKQVRDNFKKHCGAKFLDHFVELLAEYKENGTNNPDDPPTAEQLEMKDKAFNQFMALIAFKGADQNKYGPVTRKFATDYTLDDDKYPRTLEKLSDTLSSHKWDDTYFEKKKRAQEQSQRDKQGGTEEKVTSFAQHGKKTKRFCYVCGKDNHTSPICADKDKIPRSE